MEHILAFFAFPVNLVLALCWVFFCHYIWKNSKDSFVVRFLLSPAATISSIVLFLVSCIWIGITGDISFVYSIVFVLVLIYMQTVLLFVLFRGWKNRTGRIRIRFALNHAGLLIAVGSAFWGNPDNGQMRMKLQIGQSSREAYRMDGSLSWLEDEIGLVSLDCQTYENGAPMQYAAVIRIGDENHELKVNHPYSSGLSENIYLTSVGEGECVLEIVYEPWKYFALAGILMMLAGAFLLFFKGPVL